MCVSFPMLGVMDYQLHEKFFNIFKEALLRPQRHRKPSHGYYNDAFRIGGSKTPYSPWGTRVAQSVE